MIDAYYKILVDEYDCDRDPHLMVYQGSFLLLSMGRLCRFQAQARLIIPHSRHQACAHAPVMVQDTYFGLKKLCRPQAASLSERDTAKGLACILLGRALPFEPLSCSARARSQCG